MIRFERVRLIELLDASYDSFDAVEDETGWAPGFAGSVRQDVDDLGEVALGIDAVKSARGDERENVGGGLGVIVKATEEPGFSSDGDGSQSTLRGVVVEAEAFVVEEKLFEDGARRELEPTPISQRRGST